MKLLLATKNAHKLVEFRRMLEPLGYQVLSQDDVAVDMEVEETGSTFEENAALKARALYQATGLPTIADDSGLAVDALNGQPGIFSARYGNLDSDTARNELLLKNMQGIPKEQRTARFVSAIHLIFAPGDELSVRGTCEGFIGNEVVGENGFGYDPLFMVNEQTSFATLLGEEKDAMSHRGRALEAMCALLSQRK